MAAAVIGRDAEMAEVARLLTGLKNDAPVMLVEGDAGIGKTTVLRASADAALHDGVRPVMCTAGPSEMRLAYSGVADLVQSLAGSHTHRLPRPQRAALEAVMLRGDGGHDHVDPRALGTALLALLRDRLRDGALLLVVDDLQWLDRPSARIVEYVTRRLPARAGLIAARRCRGGGQWLERAARSRPRDLTTVCRLQPLDAPETERLLRERAPPLERRQRAQVVSASGGNPFYALELARECSARDAHASSMVVPESLEAVIDARLASVDPAAEEILLALASTDNPTPAVLERVFGTEALERLETAERLGVVEVDAAHVRFRHPLLAHGVYCRASGTQRRSMHRRLATAAVDLEERARHLALGGRRREAVPALVDAARQLRARGAPDAAAELLELALQLGGGEELRVTAAEYELDVGDLRRARSLLEQVLTVLPAGAERVRALLLLAEVRYKDDSLLEARQLLEEARGDPAARGEVRVRIELGLVFALCNLGSIPAAVSLAHSALRQATRLGEPALLAQALAVSVMLDFHGGLGINEARLARAIELEDPDVRTGSEFLPSLIASFLFMWTGRLDAARSLLDEMAVRHADRGEEHALAWLQGYVRITLDCWAGDLPSTIAAAESSVQRLVELDSILGRAFAAASRAQIDAYMGRVEEARGAAAEALELFARCGTQVNAVPPLATLGFVDLSVQDYEAAAARLALPAARVAGGSAEPTAGGALFTADAAEALIALSRLDEADTIVTWLEDRGAALDRTWAIAAGARCRGLLRAARGDLTGAVEALGHALIAHERLPMPIERARTLLALGRIERRRRQRLAGKAALQEALTIFEAAGTPRWAAQASAELTCLGLDPGPTDRLTASEERVARLAASGLTNQAVAGILIISPKTVEAQLTRAYRKLGIRTRAELGARMGRTE